MTSRDASPVLLSIAEMKRAEATAIAAGTPSRALMEKAGAGAAALIVQGWDKRRVSVLCGPGANGGDGLVVARVLKDAGWPVRVCVLGGEEAISGDAAEMARLYEGDFEPFSPAILDNAALIVDALFGTGLSRDIDSAAAAMIAAANAHPAPVFAIDIPSGVDADTGAVKGVAISAVRTATFFTKKPGHVLFPGRALSGVVEAVDIGIDGKTLEAIRPLTVENQPAVWGRAFPRPGFQSHKYARGGAAVVTGSRFATGAARLAAMGALRAGAGVVTLLSPREAAVENAAHATSLMVRLCDDAPDVAAFLADARYRTAVIGPGAGVNEGTAQSTLAILGSSASAVLDADALTCFSGAAERLFDALRNGDVMTPHGGEFMRLFSGLIKAPEARLSAARAAAERAGCIVVLKGADTVIAAPDGRAAINSNAPPDLATAGSGDVLAGFIAGLRAQGMPAFEAASAAVWLHGACGQAAGPGLIAEDLPSALPGVYRALFTPPRADAPRGSAEK
ncbi:MAG: NAD(P)H-hydrate dehydratase [Pseudomonadota bacterium]